MTTLTSARSLRRARALRAGHMPWESTRNAISRVIAAINREREFRRSIKELASLDERMLRDIGLTRWDVERAVRFGRA